MTRYRLDMETREWVKVERVSRPSVPFNVNVREAYFVSHSLPRWSPAKYHTKEGKPVLTSYYEATETAKRIEGESDTVCEYDQL